MPIGTRPQPERIEVPEGTPPEMARVLENIQACFDVIFRDSLQLGEESGIADIEIDDDSITFDQIQNIATDRLLGRDTAGSGNIEQLSVGGGLELTGSLSLQRSALTGDVTAAAASGVTTIGNDKVTTAKILNDNVTYAKMQNISAASRLLGRGSASGAGDPEEIDLGTGLSITGTTLAVTSAVANAAWDTILTKSSDQSVENSTTVVDETDLQLTVTAESCWLIEFLIVYSGTNATVDLKTDVQVTAGTMHGLYNAKGLSSSNAAVDASTALNAAATSTTQVFGTDAGDLFRVAHITLSAKFTAGATVKFRFASNAAGGAGTFTRVRAGSLLRAKRIV